MNNMNRNNILLTFDKDLRLHVTYPEARKEVTQDVIRFVRKAPGMNFVSYTFADGPDLDRVIDRELDYFVPMEQPFTWKVYEHDLAPHLEEKLVWRSFVKDDPEDTMILDVNDAPASLFEPVEADIRRVTDPASLKDVIHVLDTVYGNSNTRVYDRLGLHLNLPGYLSVYVAYVENQPASIAWTYFRKGHFASLFAGSTISEYRKRGLYTSLLSVRLKEIRERGYPYAIVEAGPMSKPIVAKHGFQYLTTAYDYVWKGN